MRRMSGENTFTAYLVGGGVRDALLGLAVADRDWVVVGATPAQMLAAGFLQVGRDFPVFLHPTTKEEYALARTERKQGHGHHGFVVHAAPDVTLEQDLARRDLTINAMAQAADGALIDPYGGQRDLRDKVFRHVSPAFAEDPLRVLRLARFAARFPEFTVAPETVALAKTLRDELSTLSHERVWQELARGLIATAPARALQVLLETDAWPVVLAEVPSAQLTTLTSALTQVEASVADRFAVLALACESAAHAQALAERLKVPKECAELADTAFRCRAALATYPTSSPMERVEFFVRTDAFRRGERFVHALRVANVWQSHFSASEPLILADWRAACAVDVGAVAANVPAANIKSAVLAARAQAIAAVD